MRRFVDWMFRDRSTGEIVVAQWPNLPLWIFLVASLIRRIADPDGTARTAVSAIALVALVWWAVDEVARGVNPFRRVLGAAVLAFTAWGLLGR